MINKLKMLGAAAAIMLAPVAASAVTVTAVNDYASALALVTPSESLDLSFGSSWTDAPLVVSPDASLAAKYRSPFETAGTGHISAGYYAVGAGSTYAGTANPAVLSIGGTGTEISLFWGSPDAYNTLELVRGGSVVATVVGSQFNNAQIEASFVTITADDMSEFFDTVRFYSQNASGDARNAFEFSNVTVAAVPVPAAGLLLLGALGALGVARRRKSA